MGDRKYWPWTDFREIRKNNGKKLKRQKHKKKKQKNYKPTKERAAKRLSTEKTRKENKGERDQFVKFGRTKQNGASRQWVTNKRTRERAWTPGQGDEFVNNSGRILRKLCGRWVLAENNRFNMLDEKRYKIGAHGNERGDLSIKREEVRDRERERKEEATRDEHLTDKKGQ